MSSAAALRRKHEMKIKEANEPSGQKEVVWTPQSNGTLGAHDSSGFSAQTKKQVAGGPPPKKSIKDLP